jgi:cGMP-dependent protein kinase
METVKPDAKPKAAPTSTVDTPAKRHERARIAKLVRGDTKDESGLFENIKKIEKTKTRADMELISNCLMKHFVFSSLSSSEVIQIIDKMYYFETPPGEMIFNQGDPASNFFIIAKGGVEIIINGKTVRTLSEGECFGELALLYKAPRSATAKSSKPCGFWAIERAAFHKYLEEIVQRDYADNRLFLNSVAFFNAMTSDQKDAIASALIKENYPAGKPIVNEGDEASSFYIIKEGTVAIIKAGKEIRKMAKGETFGEQALYSNTVRGCTVKAVEDAKCLAIGRQTISEILGEQVHQIKYRNVQKWAMEGNPLLSKLTKIQFEKILDKTTYTHKKAGEVIYAKGVQLSSKITIVVEGALAKGNTVVAKEGELFGSEYLVEANRTKVNDADIIMQSEGVIGELSYKSLSDIIGGPIEAAIKKSETSHEKKMMNHVSELKAKASGLKLEELIVYKKLGAGQFGSVYLVRTKGIDQFFGLKSIEKEKIVSNGLETHLLQEKSVMEMVNFPFIMDFMKSYQDKSRIYFLLEYIKGIELFDAIRDMDILHTAEAQFYTGQLILAIEYLHSKGIIYRDAKPENIMVDHTGYLKMIDLGTAKVLKEKTGIKSRTFTMIGTPQYMAPEIFSQKGYSFAADLWSLGVIVYELMCGKVPFGEEAEDPYEIYKEILTSQVKYPSFVKDLKAKKLMDQLLSKVPEVRLGGSFAALKGNAWFDDFDWDKLLDRQLKPPYLPPKQKMMTEADIAKMDSAAKKFIDQIVVDSKAEPPYRKEKASDPNWDKIF